MPFSEDLIGMGVSRETYLTPAYLLSFMISGVFFQIILAIICLTVVGQWKMLQKADKPGWAELISVYNAIVLTEIAKMPMWWVAKLFIPFVNIVFGISLTNAISKAYGKDEVFTVGLIFLPFICELV